MSIKLKPLIPLIFVVCLDASFTLIGQSQAFWTLQDTSSINESNPVAHYFLSNSPLWFILGVAGYVLIIIGLLSLIGGFFRMILGITVYMGHFYGTCAWIPVLLQQRLGDRLNEFAMWYFLIGYILVISTFTGIFLIKDEQAMKSVEKTDYNLKKLLLENEVT